MTDQANEIEDSPVRDAEEPVIVIGVGASAGGLNSIKRLFAGLQAKRGLAVVLVQHLPASHDNITVDLLKNHSALTVVHAVHDTQIQADHVYVLPSGKHLSIVDGRLRFEELEQCKGLRLPIDHFFCALAAWRRSSAVGILLSGIGSDGTMGLSEIKAEGGRTIVEDPGTADFPGMPQSAIAAGLADVVVPAEKMPDVLLAYAAEVAAESSSDGELPVPFSAILNILLIRTGHDFRCYKKNTLIRRIRRRMAINHLDQPVDYVKFMETQNDEVNLLHKDLLIGVTDFFRQPEAWHVLEEKVIPQIIADVSNTAEAASAVGNNVEKPPMTNDRELSIRVWVPGCATGKEAYSVAMLLAECVESSGKNIGIQVFATDADEQSLEIARSGLYSEDEMGSNIDKKRLDKFFIHKKGQYQIVKPIREMVVFAPQNLTSDPPFSKLNLITCRNLLIYLGREVQQQVMSVFHFSLRDGGFLFLGNAETVGGHDDLFEAVSKKWRIYRRIGAGRPYRLELPFAALAGGTAARRISQPSTTRPNSLTFVAQRLLAERFAPASVIIDRKQQILYTHGTAEQYLAIPQGENTSNIIEMAREGMRTRLAAAIRSTIETNCTTGITARVARSTGSVPIKVTITPLRQPREMDGLLLVSFEDHKRIPEQSGTVEENIADAEHGIRQLEDELKITREELQSTIEQLESSNEELKSSNEEVMASNEELQSANEELETSKEELQSLNEELNTVNNRLEEKVGELETTNNDIVNLLSSTNIATVFLDKDFKVRRFTPAITRLLSLIPSDIGRPIADITRKFTDDALLTVARRVLADLTSASNEIRTDGGQWYLRLIAPYRTHDDRIEGVVITFIDVDELKQTQESLTHVASFPLLNPQPIVEADVEGKVCFVNPAAKRLFPDIQQRGADHPYLMDWKAVVAISREGDTTLTRREITLDERWYEQWLQYVSETQRVRIYGRDITGRKRAEEALQASRRQNQFLANIVESSSQPFGVGYPDGKLGLTNKAFEELTGYSGDELRTMDWAKVLTPPEWLETEQKKLKELSESGLPVRYEKQYIRKDGTRVPIELLVHLVKDADGKPLYYYSFITDITERKRQENAIVRAKEEWERTFNSVPDLIAVLDERHRVVLANRAMAERLGLKPEQCMGLPCYKVVHGTNAPPDFCPHAQTLVDHKEHSTEVHEIRLDGDFLVTTTPMFSSQGVMTGSVHVARDITELKIAERERDTTVEFLRLVNEAKGTADLVHVAASFFHEQSGCEAVGVRLNEGDDYPYFESRGFPEEFVRLENSLCSKDNAGKPICDSAGYPLQECMCGNVIQGRFDASKPFFTARGSFWSNCTTDLLASSTDADRQARTRNRCNGEGYESVALIALGVGEERLGLLQFNDKRKDRFTPSVIALWERLADYLTVALAKTRAEDAMMQSEEQYRTLFSTMLEGFCIIEMVFGDDGKPVDYRFLAVNPAFEKQTGLHDAQGKLMRNLAPDHEALWFEIYGRIALTGEPARFVNEAKALNRWYDVSAFRVGGAESHKVAILFNDVTESKLTTEELAVSQERLELALTSSEMATFDWDTVTNKRIWGDGVHRLLGTLPETFTGKAEEFFNVIHPDDRSTVKTSLAKAMETGDYYAEYRVVWPDGSIHHIAAKGKVHRNGQGQPVRMAGVCWDITQRKQAEEKLRESNNELTRFNNAMVNRELRMIELKTQVNEMCAKAGLPAVYKVDF
jgi:PAS domain S-box-containing protein